MKLTKFFVLIFVNFLRLGGIQVWEVEHNEGNVKP